jgi:hypothetical protein
MGIDRTASRRFLLLPSSQQESDPNGYVNGGSLFNQRDSQGCLVEKRMNPRVVMEIGGWEDYAALEPYLNKPSPGTIVAEFESAGLA